MGKLNLSHFIRQKRKELTLGFSSFALYSPNGECIMDGLLNIGKRLDDSGNGFLVISCIMDTPGTPEKRSDLRDAFRRLNFSRKPPKGLLTVIRTGVTFHKAAHMEMEEFTFSVSPLEGRHHELLEKHIIPEFSRCGFHAGAPHWFKKGKPAKSTMFNNIVELSVKKLFG